jgi:hypothetical protein
MEEEVPEEAMTELCEHLNVADMNLPYLHTLVLLEDSTHFEQLQKQNSYLNDLMIQCAHVQMSFFVIIHYWKAITTNLKATLSTIYIYGGYSRQQLTYIIYQMNLPATAKDIYDTYQSLSQYSKLIVDSQEGAIAVSKK